MDYEKYKLVNDFEDYIIFSTGKVFSLKRYIFLKPGIEKKNYKHFTLSNENGKKMFKLHRLLGLHFLPNPHNLPTVDHIDINPGNNELENLRWSSYRLQALNKKLKKNNVSGVAGVHYCKKWKCYIARVNTENKRIGKAFSVKEYGETEAFRLAVNHRIHLANKYYKNII